MSNPCSFDVTLGRLNKQRFAALTPLSTWLWCASSLKWALFGDDHRERPVVSTKRASVAVLRHNILEITAIGMAMKTDRPVNLNLFAFSRRRRSFQHSSNHRHHLVWWGGFCALCLGHGLASPKVLLRRRRYGAAATQANSAGFVGFLIFHIFAGLKHLMLDFHLGDSVAASHRGSLMVIILTIVSTAGLGVALW